MSLLSEISSAWLSTVRERRGLFSPAGAPTPPHLPGLRPDEEGEGDGEGGALSASGGGGASAGAGSGGKLPRSGSVGNILGMGVGGGLVSSGSGGLSRTGSGVGELEAASEEIHAHHLWLAFLLEVSAAKVLI